MKIIVTIFTLVMAVSSQAAAQLTSDDVKQLPTEKIIIYAKMGDAEAQYWLANALRTGSIPNWRDFPTFEFLDLYEDAANQGHGLAAYELGAYLVRNAKMLKDLRTERDENQAIRFLNIAIKNGVPEAHMQLYYLYKKPFNEKLSSDLLAGKHLEDGANAGLAEAMSELGLAKTLGYADDFFLQNNVEEGIDLFTRSWTADTGRFESPSNASSRVCNDILFVAEIFMQDGRPRFSALTNSDRYLGYLEVGSSYNCPTIMYRLASHLHASHLLLDGNPDLQSEKLKEAYILASRAAMVPDGFWAHRHHLLAEIAWAVGDMKSYKNSIARIIKNDRSWDDMVMYLLKENQTENGAGGCINKGLRSVQCNEYLQ